MIVEREGFVLLLLILPVSALSRTWLDGEFDWGGTPSKL